MFFDHLEKKMEIMVSITKILLSSSFYLKELTPAGNTFSVSNSGKCVVFTHSIENFATRILL